MEKTGIRRTVWMLALAAALTATSFARADEPTDSFQIALPTGYGPFAKQVQKTPSPEGETETTTWVSKSAAGNAVIVAVSRMPGRILNPEKLMATTRESLLKSLGGTLESEQKRDTASPSMRVLFRSNTAFFRARLVVDDDTLYQLLHVARSAEGRQDSSVDALFGSFEIKAHEPPSTR